ncbi:hypothetical protein L596_009546 [Steinernema carpocapsae]|uniref:CCR4-NOT transcription complex subunit 9 n=1 Tax=Steinernema carpocapsae TaxID=34508 RepID=A0A4U5PFN6_STECR|nr:hypothetical protein L596_009546 [Steinernema carpocapsae]
MMSDYKEEVKTKLAELREVSLRAEAVTYLVNHRSDDPELPNLIMGTNGALQALFQEVLAVYPYLDPPRIPSELASRACQALALLQKVASDRIGAVLFIRCDYIMFVLPFMYSLEGGTMEHLRTAALGVVGALLTFESENEEVVQYLMRTPMIPLCLRMMAQDTSVITTLGTFVLQKILSTRPGLTHCCALPERVANVVSTLNIVLHQVAMYPSPRLLRTVLRCYRSLTNNHRALPAIRLLLPPSLKDGTFDDLIEENEAIEEEWRKLLEATATCDLNSSGGTGMTDEEIEEELAKEMVLTALQGAF